MNECVNEMPCAERSRDWRQRLWRGGTGRKRKHGWQLKLLLLQKGGVCSVSPAAELVEHHSCCSAQHKYPFAG